MKGIKIVNRKKETCSTFKLKLEPGTYSITELGKIINSNGTLKMRWQREKWKAFPQTATQSDGQKFLLPSSTPRNSRRFTKIFIPRFFVRHAQDVFQSVHEILLSWFKK